MASRRQIESNQPAASRPFPGIAGSGKSELPDQHAATRRQVMTSALKIGASVAAGASLWLPNSAKATTFDHWVWQFWSTAEAAGISRGVYEQAFAGVQPDAEVIRLANRQPEFSKPIWAYLASAVSNTRIENGLDQIKSNARALHEIEQRYGVSKYICVAIWGMESSYGAVLKNKKIVRPTIRSLATLAYQGGPRQGFGREQLIAALKILQRGDVSPANMYGSWAGAMGHTQFIPTTYNAYAVDFDGDGRRNIWTSIPDALGSTANYLKASGWRSGETWGYEVAIPSGFDYALADETTERTVLDWVHFGLRRTRQRQFPRADDRATLILPAGARGPAFLMLTNFSVIKRYNNATSYALGVGHLADRLLGAPSFEQPWPVDDQPLARLQVEEMQRLLAQRGFSPGGVDGRVGPMTRAAVRSFQRSVGLAADGYPTNALLSRLRGG